MWVLRSGAGSRLLARFQSCTRSCGILVATKDFDLEIAGAQSAVSLRPVNSDLRADISDLNVR